jgi:hypothetical protein
MRRVGFLLLTLLCAFPALADSYKGGPITIGTFTYLGETPQGNSQYEIAFNTTGITVDPLQLNVSIVNQRSGATFGTFPTVGPPIVVTGYVNCPCTFINYGVYFAGGGPGPFPIQLVNGQTFVAYLATNSPPFLPSPGNTYVTVGESGPILLRAVPEPGTMLLFGSGLAGLIARRGLLKKPVTRYLR